MLLTTSGEIVDKRIFSKFAINFQAENQKEEKRLLAESEKSINELAEKLTTFSPK
jgi:hypothetical protein